MRHVVFVCRVVKAADNNAVVALQLACIMDAIWAFFETKPHLFSSYLSFPAFFGRTDVIFFSSHFDKLADQFGKQLPVMAYVRLPATAS